MEMNHLNAAEMGKPLPEREHLVEAIENLSRQISSLAEEQKKSNVQGSGMPKKGHPLLFGLGSVGITAMIVQFHNIGWLTAPLPVICFAILLGGICQLIAATHAFDVGSNFGYSMGIYGTFWITHGIILICNEFDFKVDQKSMGYVMLAFTLFTGVATLASLGLQLYLFCIMCVLLTGFVLLTLGFFTGNPAVQLAGFWTMLFCSLMIFYVVASILCLEAFEYDILPMGPIPALMIKEWVLKKKRAKTTKKAVEAKITDGVLRTAEQTIECAKF